MLFSSPPPEWRLNPQLEKDTTPLGDLALSRVLVIADATFPWLLLVPRRVGVAEIIDLTEVEQAQLMTEIARVSRALKEVTACDKLNVAALGNMVPHLHWHVIGRFADDSRFPDPVWAPPRRPGARRAPPDEHALRAALARLLA